MKTRPYTSPWLRRMGARAVTLGGGDCWHPERHAEHHHPHPQTGRPVCHVCHPPAGGSRS